MEPHPLFPPDFTPSRTAQPFSAAGSPASLNRVPHSLWPTLKGQRKEKNLALAFVPSEMI